MTRDSHFRHEIFLRLEGGVLFDRGGIPDPGGITDAVPP